MLHCRHCGSSSVRLFLDLGYAPPSNAYVTKECLNLPETTYPLRLLVCQKCFLVQTQDFTNREDLFNADYAYFSSTSKSWLKHAQNFCEKSVTRFNLGKNSFVIEIGSNDGYLLQYFVKQGVPCLGIEPTKSTADFAREKGIDVKQEFFGVELAQELSLIGKNADLVIGNNVYAHVPDINDFTSGVQKILKPGGVVSLEFPHLLQLIENCQFDTVYHEHFSYLSLGTVMRIFDDNGLRVFDVEELSTHGGSLRVYGCLKTNNLPVTKRVDAILNNENEHGMSEIGSFLGFQSRVDDLKNTFLEFLIRAQREGKKVAAYGAAAKGNTLMNYSGVRSDLIPYICDAAVSKQGKFTPGNHIPIVSPSNLLTEQHDYIVIFPWNIADEIKLQFSDLAEQGTRFVTVVPELRIT